MENQHRKIKGYRELTQPEIDLMNQVKEQGLALEAIINKLGALHADSGGALAPDMRWVGIGETHLQQGLMALTRSIAKPDFF